jgi:hypothetical protein
VSRRSSAPDSGTTTFGRFASSWTCLSRPRRTPQEKSNREDDRTASNYLDDGSSQGRAHKPKADVGDRQQLDHNHDVSQGERGAELRQEKRKGMTHRADRRSKAGYASSDKRTSSTGYLAVIG